MEFFNPYEDVLDIQMTEYGKSLFSQGKFRPRFYSFSDEGVIYNSQKNQSPVSQIEKQNEIGKRISGEDVIYNKILQRRFSVNYEKTIIGTLLPASDAKEEGTDFSTKVQEKFSNNSEQEKLYYSNLAIINSLGNLKIGSQNSPAFKVFVGTSNISGSSQFYSAQTTETSGHEQLLIPQIDIEMIARTTIVDFDSPNDSPIKLSQQQLENLLSFSGDRVLADNGIPIVETPDLFLIIEEENVDFDITNYEIEVYDIGDVVSSKTGNYPLRKLEHRLSDEDFETVDNILLSKKEKDTLTFSNSINTFYANEALDFNRVDYYIDILTDYSQILDPRVLCAYQAELKSLGFDTEFVECPDVTTPEFQEQNIYVSGNGPIENCP